MAKLRSFKFSDEADKVLLGIQERTNESLTTILEKGIFYYAKKIQDEMKKAPKTLMDLDLNSLPDTNPLDVPFTLNAENLDTYGSKKRKKWLEADIKQLKKMDGEGKTIKEIAKYLDRPEASVRKKLWELNGGK